jgi:hypothetical protein
MQYGRLYCFSNFILYVESETGVAYASPGALQNSAEKRRFQAASTSLVREQPVLWCSQWPRNGEQRAMDETDGAGK